MAKLKIKEMLDKKGITRYALAKNIGVTYPTIDKIYNGETSSIRLSTLENICRELDCTPNDIIYIEETTHAKEKMENRLITYSQALDSKNCSGG